MPIIERVMAIYAGFGHTDFVVATGYKADQIAAHFGARAKASPIDGGWQPGWTVACVDTGALTATGGRIKRLAGHLGDETFMLTYTDGLANLDLEQLVAFHKQHGKLATVTAVHPPPRFGHLRLEKERVTSFDEKPEGQEGWINGGFYVLEPGIFEYLDNDQTVFEKTPAFSLARDGQLMAYRHEGQWNCMDTPADIATMESLAGQGLLPGYE